MLGIVSDVLSDSCVSKRHVWDFARTSANYKYCIGVIRSERVGVVQETLLNTEACASVNRERASIILPPQAQIRECKYTS